MVGPLLSERVNVYLPTVLGTRIMSTMVQNCTSNCSGHGECDTDNGICVCEVQFNGDTCMEPNKGYYVAFATIFNVISIISMIQLVVCIHSEYKRMKQPLFGKACRVTTQKAIYMIIAMASFIRGLYFSYQGLEPQWASLLMSAYFPILLTGYSIIVCFWAEVFHLPDAKLDKPRFLEQSIIGFIGFNVITYSLLLVEFILVCFTERTDTEKSFLNNVFYGAYASLMFIVVVFFFFYGVEVYFKIRGSFANSESPQLNSAQLNQSRFGLVFQGCLLLITVAFLFSDICGGLWKNKVHVLSRNWYDVTYRLAELGVALWFPCVLWNCMSPEQLWILNPQRILKQLDRKPSVSPESVHLVQTEKHIEVIPTSANFGDFKRKIPECWICYDSERTDAGPLIQPCLCKGDVGTVHHDCLRRWLVESAEKVDRLECKVCQQPYKLQKGHFCIPANFTLKNWLCTLGFIACIGGSMIGAWFILQRYEDTGIRILAVGSAVLITYVCLKFMGFNAVTAYQKAKVSAVRIIGRQFSVVSTVADGAGNSSNMDAVELKISMLNTGLPKPVETRL